MVGALALIVLTLVMGLFLQYVLRAQGLSDSANWAQLISLLLAVLQLVPLFIGTDSMTDSQKLKNAREDLGRLVLAQWREEIAVRQLDRPGSLAVRWKLTELGVMDHAAHVVGTRRGTPRFTARTDQMHDFTARFLRLPRRRMVILGTPGTGKTTLAVLLLRELLQNQHADDPVPVLLSMSGWDPRVEGFYDWLSRRVSADYPALRAPAFGPDIVRELIAGRHILPILDGLDELPQAVRPAILRALNASLIDSDPLVLTCRTREFVDVIAASPGGVLSGAAVIEPQPLRVPDVVSYVRRSLPPQTPGPWADVLAAIESSPDDPLATALTSPLGVWLMRTVYIAGDRDPRELLDESRFGTPEKVLEHLLDHLVPALFDGGSPDRDTPDDRVTWNATDATRYLSFLARHLDTIGTRDLYWWQLQRALPPRWVVLAAGLVLGGLCGLILGVIGGLAIGMTVGIATGTTAWGLGVWIGLATGVFTGLFFAGSVAAVTSPATEPSFADLRFRGRLQPLVRQLSIGLTLGPPTGLLIGLLFVPLLGLWPGLATGLIVGTALGLAGALADWAKVPLSTDVPQAPRESLRRDAQLIIVRQIVSALTLAPASGIAGGLILLGIGDGLTTSVKTVLAAAAFGAILGIVLGIAGGLKIVPPGTTIPFGTAGGTMLGHRVGLARGRVEASVIYLVTVLALWRRGDLPRRPMMFLDDAHKLGVLRLAGPAYQFRHASLHDRLRLAGDGRE